MNNIGLLKGVVRVDFVGGQGDDFDLAESSLMYLKIEFRGLRWMGIDYRDAKHTVPYRGRAMYSFQRKWLLIYIARSANFCRGFTVTHRFGCGQETNRLSAFVGPVEIENMVSRRLNAV